MSIDTTPAENIAKNINQMSFVPPFISHPLGAYLLQHKLRLFVEFDAKARMPLVLMRWTKRRSRVWGLFLSLLYTQAHP